MSFPPIYEVVMARAKTETTISITGEQGSFKGLRILPNFTQSGKFTRMKQINSLNHRSGEPDLLDLMGSMSKGARDLFLQMKNAYNWRTGISQVDTEGLSRGQKVNRVKHLNELYGLGIASKVPAGETNYPSGASHTFKANTFIINPAYLLPAEGVANEVLFLWKRSIQKTNSIPQARSQKLISFT
jgi:hypothetical protein